MVKLGVIPAAGKAVRWFGCHKELLPIGRGMRLIDRTIKAMDRGGADALLVIASADKMHELSSHISRAHPKKNVYYAIQQGDNDIWSAIVECFAYPADEYLFAMPDTVFSTDIFASDMVGDFVMGVFQTDEPERFGTLRRGQIVNKEPGEHAPYSAWGVLNWSLDCVHFWRSVKPENYTDAINRAIDKFGIRVIEMDYYHDIASFEDYKEWLCR